MGEYRKYIGIMKNIVAIDDHQLFLDGLKGLVNSIDDWNWEAGFTDARKFLKQLDTLSVDLLLLDISMPILNGFKVLAELQNRNLQIPVIFLTSLKHPLLIARLEISGARGCILKEDSVNDLREILNEVRGGEEFCMSKSLQEIVNPRLRSLSPREFEILDLIAKGFLNKEIAGQLKISEGTVITHRKRIKDKAGVCNAADMATLAKEMGIC